MRHSAEMLVCSTQLFSRSHPRKHPADPPEHLERSVGLRPSGGRPTRSRACFVITGGTEGVYAHASLIFTQNTHDSQSHTCGPANILAHSARGAQRHATRNTRRETRDRRRSSFIHPPEPPGHAADPPRPTQPTLPHKAVRASTSALLAAPPAHCSSSSSVPARSPASPVV